MLTNRILCCGETSTFVKWRVAQKLLTVLTANNVKKHISQKSQFYQRESSEIHLSWKLNHTKYMVAIRTVAVFVPEQSNFQKHPLVQLTRSVFEEFTQK